MLACSPALLPARHRLAPPLTLPHTAPLTTCACSQVLNIHIAGFVLSWIILLSYLLFIFKPFLTRESHAHTQLHKPHTQTLAPCTSC